MTATDTAAALDILRRLDTLHAAKAANRFDDAPFWFAYNTWGEWCLCLCDFDDDTPDEIYGPGAAGEEAALRVAIQRNRALLPAEPVAQEVEE